MALHGRGDTVVDQRKFSVKADRVLQSQILATYTRHNGIGRYPKVRPITCMIQLPIDVVRVSLRGNAIQRRVRRGHEDAHFLPLWSLQAQHGPGITGSNDSPGCGITNRDSNASRPSTKVRGNSWLACVSTLNFWCRLNFKGCSFCKLCHPMPECRLFAPRNGQTASLLALLIRRAGSPSGAHSRITMNP